MKRTGSPKHDHFRLWYTDGAELVGSHRLPQLKRQNHIPRNVRSWNERSQLRNLKEHWLDFYIDDYHSEPVWNALVGCVESGNPDAERFWRRMDSYMTLLKRCEGVIATDFSMLPNMLPDQRNWNCARNRISAYYLESNGIPTIPVACWSGREDYPWCFDGLPEESSIAISSNGCLSSTEGILTLLDGVEELVYRKNPSLLIVCGRKVPEIEDICKNVMYYPSFSQRMKDRIQRGK